MEPLNWHKGCPLPGGTGNTMSIIRRWAALRGERCLATVVDVTAPYAPGQEIIAGNRAYVVTRVLRTEVVSPTVECSWEVWARRRVNKGWRPSAS